MKYHQVDDNCYLSAEPDVKEHLSSPEVKETRPVQDKLWEELQQTHSRLVSAHGHLSFKDIGDFGAILVTLVMSLVILVIP